MNRTRTFVLALVAGLFAALTFGGLMATSASAQGPGSEFCQQYPSFPGCQTGPTGPGGPNEPGEPVDPGVTGSADAGAADNLPFTGYPLTALILLLLALLLAGLAIRVYLAVRDRIAGDRTLP